MGRKTYLLLRILPRKLLGIVPHLLPRVLVPVGRG